MRLVAVLVLTLVSSSAFAQSVIRQIDISALGWGQVDARPIETDGNPTTEEWLVQARTLPGLPVRFRVVAVRHTLCVSDWFTPDVQGRPLILDTMRGQSVLIAQGVTVLGSLPIVVIALDTPACP